MPTTFCQRFAEARILAAKLMPYMRANIMSLVPVERLGFGTMAMDEHGRLYYDPKFLEVRDLKHCAFVVLHEDLHFYGRHAKRRVACIGANPSAEDLAIWRQVVDSSVNEMLVQSGLTCPDEGVLPEKIGLPKNLTPEQGFAILRKKRDEKKAEHERQAQEEQKAQEQAEQEEADEQDSNAQESEPEANEPQDDQEADESDADGDADGEGESEEDGEGDGQGEGEKDDQGEGESDDAGEDSQDGDGDGEADDSPEGGEDGQDEESGESSGDADGEGSGPAGSEGDGQTESQSPSEIGGSAADGIPRPWELGPPSEENPGLDESEQNLLEAQTAKAIEDHVASRGRGSVAAGLAKQASELLHKPVDPTRALAAKVKYAVDRTSGFGDYSYSRFSNRVSGGCILPNNVKPIPRVTVIVDTSGSMGGDDLALGLEIIGNALRNLPDPRGLRVLVGGTRVERAVNVFRKESVELLEGGGTDMSVLIQQAAEDQPEPKVIIVVTDTETPWPAEPVKPKVLVCATRKSRWMRPPPAWMDVVYLRPEDK
jgi:predicted metal-dependent peptidase